MVTVLRQIIRLVESLVQSSACRSLGRNSRTVRFRGVLVLDAREGGPAERAGIRSTKRDDSGRALGDAIGGIKTRKSKTPMTSSALWINTSLAIRSNFRLSRHRSKSARFYRQVGRHQRHETAVDKKFEPGENHRFRVSRRHAPAKGGE